jgi:sporulation protein YlmC with PRC-barrel domain
MTIDSTSRTLLTRTLLTQAASGVLVGLALTFAGSTWVPASAASQPQSSPSRSQSGGQSDRQDVLDAIMQAHAAAQQRQGPQTVNRIERAQVALLNLRQLHPDPRLDQALAMLDQARDATRRNDLRAADEHLLAAANDLAAMPSLASSDMIRPDQRRASRMIGDAVYDGNDQKIGDVIDIVLDNDGTVAAVVIGLGDDLGMGDKNVAVPMNDIHTDHRYMTLDRSRDQLRQSASYQLGGQNTGAGSSSMPEHGGQSGPAMGGSQRPSR